MSKTFQNMLNQDYGYKESFARKMTTCKTKIRNRNLLVLKNKE